MLVQEEVEEQQILQEVQQVGPTPGCCLVQIATRQVTPLMIARRDLSIPVHLNQLVETMADIQV